MRLIIILMTIGILHVSAAGYAQRITLSEKQASLENIINKIRTQSGYDFLGDTKLIRTAKPISINVKEATIEDVLDICFEGQRISYSIDNKIVVLKEKSETFLERLADRWAAIDISGTVVDEKGIPLPGATVKAKGAKSVITDIKGRFMLENVEEGAIVTISYTGYVTQELPAKQAMGAIALKLSENPLDQVQIIAYGTTSRRLSVSNTVTVTAKEIEQQPVNNPLLALQGRVPGVTVIQSSGVPGSGVTIRIQGRNNLDNTLVGSDPLIVIDGLPYASQNLKTFSGGSREAPILGSSSNDDFGSAINYGNPLAYINPADIESITVLKDADATAIYGSRAANGAILIATKKGKTGNIKTDFKLQQGLGRIGHKMDLLNSEQYMEMRREAKRNDHATINSTDYDLRGVWDTTRYTDWQKELIGGTASFTRLTAGVSGGSTTSQYLVSSTYGRETSVFPGNFANTFGSVHFNFSANSSNQRFKLHLVGSYIANNNRLPGQDYTRYALNLPPVAPALYNTDGSVNWAQDPITGNSTWFNPLSKQDNLFETKTNNLISSGGLSYRVVSGLELKSTFGFTSTTSDQFVAALDGSVKPENRGNRIRIADFTFNTSRSWIVEPQLNYQKEWNSQKIAVLLGSTFQHQNNNGRAFRARGQSSDLLLRDMLAGTSILAMGTDINEYKYNAIFGRFSYSFKDKYLMNLTARRDGSSRFGSNSQFNNFWALGAGWILSEEQFFKSSLPFLSFAKFRGSYGVTGNDQIGNYRFMNLFYSSFSTINYQGVGGLVPQDLPNPNLEWEETRKFQTGLDLGVCKDRILFTVNYARNRSSNSLTYVQMPLVTGFGTLLQNLPALIQNKSWEFLLTTLNINNGKFRWSSNLNLTIPRNKLLKFPGLETASSRQFLIVGEPLSTQKSYPFYDVDPQNGLYRVANRYGEPTSTPETEDLTVYMNYGPRWYGGIQNSISYKGFSLDFLIQVTKQYSFDILLLDGTPGTFSSSNAALMYGNQPVSVMKRWQMPGDNGTVERFSTSGLGTERGDLAYRNASFLRLKNVSFSYEIPTQILQKAKMQQLRFYADAQNLFTLTGYQGLDPETLSISSLPPLRMITLGLQVTF